MADEQEIPTGTLWQEYVVSKFDELEKRIDAIGQQLDWLCQQLGGAMELVSKFQGGGMLKSLMGGKSE